MLSINNTTIESTYEIKSPFTKELILEFVRILDKDFDGLTEIDFTFDDSKAFQETDTLLTYAPNNIFYMCDMYHEIRRGFIKDIDHLREVYEEEKANLIAELEELGENQNKRATDLEEEISDLDFVINCCQEGRYLLTLLNGRIGEIMSKVCDIVRLKEVK